MLISILIPTGVFAKNFAKFHPVKKSAKILTKPTVEAKRVILLRKPPSVSKNFYFHKGRVLRTLTHKQAFSTRNVLKRVKPGFKQRRINEITGKY